MSFQDYFRILCGISAFLGAILLVLALVRGRARFHGVDVRRAAAPRPYWASIGTSLILVTVLGFGAALEQRRLTGPVLFTGLFAALLCQILVSGRFGWGQGRVFTPLDGARAYWGWTAAFLLLFVLNSTFLINELAWPTIP
jgi:hypothetical protein